MCLVIGYLCCGLPLSKPPLLCGVCGCECVCVSVCVCVCLCVCFLYMSIYVDFLSNPILSNPTSGLIQSECVCMSVQALCHIRLGKYRPLAEDKPTLLAVSMRRCLRHYYYYYFYSSSQWDGQAHWCYLTIVSPCSRQSHWFSFGDSKRVVEEETEEEL